MAHRKLQDLGYTGSERTTRRARAKRAYAAGSRRVYRPWIPEPGMWLQFDWGHGPMVAGRQALLWCAWLAWSRYRSGEGGGADRATRYSHTSKVGTLSMPSEAGGGGTLDVTGEKIDDFTCRYRGTSYAVGDGDGQWVSGADEDQGAYVAANANAPFFFPSTARLPSTHGTADTASMATDASHQPSRSVATPRRAALRRALALGLYVAGALWSLGALQASMTALWTRDVLLAVVWLIPALAGWWISAGIGMRLGTSPRQFLDWLSGILGFNRTDRRVDSD